METPVRFSFLIRPEGDACNFIKKKALTQGIRTEYGEIQSISLYSVQMWENAE